MIQKNKILTAVLMAGILSVVSLSGSGVTRAESVQTGQTEKKVIGASFASGEASYQEALGTLLEERAKADSDQYSLKSSMQTGMCPNRKSRYKILSKNGQMPLSCVR